MAVVGVLLVVVIGAMAIQITTDVVDGPDWQYDEYRQIDGVVSASGALEIVDVAGTTYVHAASLGQGRLVMSDGSVTTVGIGPAVLDLVLMTGQSNSTWRPETADPATAEPVPPLGTSYVFAQADGDYSHLNGAEAEFMPVVSSTGELNTSAQAPAFCAEYVESTGHRVYLVCGGWPGAPIKNFDPESGTAWHYMKTVLGRAVDAVDQDHYRIRSTCYTWIQGEANASTAVETYTAAFMKMHDAILNGELGESFEHCFISLVKSGNARTAQIEIAEAHPDTVTIAYSGASDFTVDNGLLNSDGVHYTQAGNNLVGSALGSVAGSWASGLKEVSTQNALMSVWPVIIGIAVAVSAIGLALRALAGRD